MKKKITLWIILIPVSLLLLALLIPFTIFGVRSALINNDYQYLLDEEKIEAVNIDNVKVVKQEISCGYAIIEILTTYYGSPISEQELYNSNNKSITTATTSGFVGEINKRIHGLSFVSKEYLKNDELLQIINKSLVKGNPVAIEWAAIYEGIWTLHWSVVTGMDNNYIYISNPYGYEEVITYNEFISRTTFMAFTKMNIGYYFGFAYGLFSKNTIIVAEGY